MAVALATLSLPAAAQAGMGDGGADELRAARRLRQRAATLRSRDNPLRAPDQDVGQVVVMEHDGSDYSRSEPDGTPNYGPRAALAQRFYQSHGDFYDFLVVFTNFEFDTGPALAFHNLVRNDVAGIGKPIVDNGPLFGSPGRLRGYIDMAALDRYGPQALSTRPGVPLSTQPGEPGFRDTLNVLAHELAHQWLAFVRYRDAGGASSGDLLGRDGAHWSYLLDSDASVMYGADWVAQAGGGYRAQRVLEGYSALDRYLMGFLDPARVEPFTLLRAPGVDPTGLPLEGALVQGDAESVALGQVLAAEGPRVPGFLAAPKSFRVGFVLLTAPGTSATPEDLAAVERVREAFAAHFFELTAGAAVADTTLAETPPGPPAPLPDLALALQWLLARQLSDGRWEDGAGSALRDTPAALDALRDGGVSGAPYEGGLAWLRAASPRNTDFAARRAQSLAAALGAAEKAALAAALLEWQNRDGGFGAGPGYQSDPLDTALALRALAALGWPADAKVARALVYLRATRALDGGWAALPGGETSSVATAQGLQALQDWAGHPVAQPLLGPVLAALAARRNADGGFGDGPSTPYASAAALRALLRGGAPAATVDPVTAWLQSAQRDDGSWNGSPYQTALVLAALKGGTTPNLVVPPDALTLAPAAPREGQVVRVTALVRNAGRRAAPASRARLYDGDPGDPAHAVADLPVAELQPGEEAPVAFDYPTQDRAGSHTLYVVADADHEVAEAREDDNAAARALTVVGRLADLVLGPGDLDVLPYPPEEGETVEIRVSVRNAGQRDALASRLRVYRGNPRQGGVALAEAPLPALAQGATAVVSLAWDTTGAQGQHELFAVADPDYALDELDETNNEASLPVTVTGPVPPEPDLEVARVSLDPPVQVSIPQAVAVRVLVRNLGRQPVASTVRLSDDAGTTYGDMPLSLGPRSGTTLVFAASVVTGGGRSFTAVADPDGALPEPDEGNNQAGATLEDPGTTFDLELLSGEVTPSATDLVVGDTLTVSALVHNRGTAPVYGLPVQLVHALPTPVELARVLVDVPPGGVASASLAWPAGFAAVPLPLAVVADPFDLLPELDESNNRVALSVNVSASDLPNLAVSGADVQLVPDPPLEGASAQVRVVVRNTGAVPAGPCPVEFWRGDPGEGGQLIGSVALPGLEAGAQAVPEVTWGSVDVRGVQGLFVRVDPAGEVQEFDEGDNQAFRPFTSLGLPDLVLTAADVRLAPGYPRAGEPVTVEARVRNLGAQAAPATLLRASEGDGPGSTVVGESAVPALAPGEAALVSLAWTPASPAGERTLELLADAGDAAREQDEGNNRVRRSVVVQDANLYLTEPYFSPDGDGTRDETTLAWRATGTPSVSVVVSNARGKALRTLVADGPAEGSATWDGRDARGRLMWDGRYTFTLKAANGAVLGRREALLDTNRSPIHDAAGTGLLAVRNLTCALPQLQQGPAFTPAGDEALFILNSDDATTGVQAGLLRVAADGQYSHVGAPDAWYQEASFPFYGYSDRPSSPVSRLVSPDGREVLVRHSGNELWAVDLVDGTRRLLGSDWFNGATWSPDGTKILAGDRVLLRDGSLHAYLSGCCGEWAWSPDGQFLAQGNDVYTAGGEYVKTIPFPGGFGEWSTVDWRGDGLIFLNTGGGGESRAQGPGRGSSDGGGSFFLLDPENDTSQALTWLDDLNRADWVYNLDWSPDGSRLAWSRWNGEGGDVTEVTREDGRFTRLLGAGRITPSATDVVASFEVEGEGQVCNGWSETYALFNLQNLTAELQVSRLAANNGLMLRGTASDAWLERWQLEFAREEAPGTWRPIGAASDQPAVNDELAVWVPPAPGRYVVRLTAVDRAGNSRSSARVVSWSLAPAIVNLTQTELLISPNGDGRRDAVRFDYLVQEPTRLDVRVIGPTRPGQPSPEQRRFSFEYPDLGPASFTWDGRDASGQVVPDGRYTVALNGLPMRVDVDTTPPDQAWSEGAPEIRTEAQGEITRVYVGLTRSMHVVDPHLKAWLAPEGDGTEQVYDPERDADGRIVYDERGVPVIRYANGHPADLVEEAEIGGNVERLAFSAEDRAGNISQVAEPARPERLFLLEAREPDGTQRLLPPRSEQQLHELRPPQITFLLATTALEPGSPVFFRFQRESGGSWSEAPAGLAWNARYEDLGLAFGVVYRGEFVQRLATGEIRSDVFRFRVCEAAGDIAFSGAPVAPGMSSYRTEVTASVGEPITGVRLVVEGGGRFAGLHQETAMSLLGGSYQADVLAPTVSCAEPDDTLSFSARVTGASGRVYSGNLGCLRLSARVPVCPNRLDLAQDFRGCGQTADDVYLRVKAVSEASDARVLVERGPADAPVLLAELRPPVETDLHVDVTGEPQGGFPVRARLLRAGQAAPLASREIEVRVDRTPPEALILEPVEGGTQCVARDPQTGQELLRLALEVDDGSPRVELGPGRQRLDEDAWRQLVLACPPGTAPGACRWLPTGEPFDRFWDVSSAPSGPYTVEQTFCDGSGNRAVETRHFQLSKQPPYLTVDAVSRRVFSPNGDGRADETTVTFGLAQALRLTVDVRRGSAAGALVRRLVSDQTFPAGQHALAWDGRDGSGNAQPDGDYFLVAEGLDGCFNVGRVSALVTVDVTPPVALIAQPSDGQLVSSSVDVRGRATDAHFGEYELAFGEGVTPAGWTVVRAGGGQVGLPPGPAGALGNWAPPPVPGPDPVFFTLRLVAVDAAENTSEARVTVPVGPRLFLDHLSAEPAVFSPNGDGRRETVALEYRLLLPGRVTLQVRRLDGSVQRTLEAAADHPAGTYAFAWDGLRDDGAAAPEEELQAVVRVEDPAGGPSFQEQAVLFALDRTPPALELLSPGAGSFVDRTGPVRGSVDDPRLTRWSVSATDPAGALYALGQGTEPRQDSFLAPLDLLPDGPYTLVLGAEDEAENVASRGLSFTVDSIAPEAGLELRPRQVLRRGPQPIAVQGRATDLNLAEWVLSFGAGEVPASFVEIARGTAGGQGLTLGLWQVASVPDGPYTVRLTVLDKAGHQAEARETVVLDGTPPEAVISLPAGEGYVTAETGIEGDARDANLASWKLESAPGPAAQAYQWTELATGEYEVQAGLLATWAPLPADGVHTLRLTVEDQAGFTSLALRTVTVDTTPPAAPTGLAAAVQRRDDVGDVRLTWNANAEPDLAGYRVFRDDEELTDERLPTPLLLDAGRPDGTYRYQVVAVDLAGNASAPAALPVRVDLTPPLADIQRPLAGARVSGSLDVRGTAYSPEDFKEYRLSVGVGADPASFTLLRRSTLPVPGGVLGSWTAVGDGPFTLLLEAEDTSGNQASRRVTVIVDNEAPSPPVLVSVLNQPAPETLTSTWTASSASDVDGYLLERNGQIANAPGVVVGDLRPYLLPGPSYADAGLPDGEHCYRVTAMDAAGNLSAASNEICRALDNHPPHVLLLEPPDGLRFDYPVGLLGYSPDTDVASVLFQYRPSGSPAWLDVGPADTRAPFEIVFDPLPLAFGDYDLRALATDTHGNVDPAPESVTVTYGDATAPATPRDVAALVDGHDVTVAWAAAPEDDLAGYNVYRDGELLTPAPQAATSYLDAGREPAGYQYAVTAVDQDGNESAPGRAEAVVYQVRLEQPYPVRASLEAPLAGDGARPETTVTIERDGAAVAAVPVVTGPTFELAALPLVTGPNLVTARGEDARGNRSIPSDEAVLIANEAPPAVADLAAAVGGHTVGLAWTPVVDPELAGYVVRRDGQRLTPSLPQADASVIAASSTYPWGSYEPARAFDGDSGTAWIPETFPASWTVTFPEPVLVEKVGLQFASFDPPPSAERYRVEVLWEGRYLPVARASANAAPVVEHVLPAPFQTTGLRVVIESGPYVGLAEVAVTRLDAVPATAASWQDAPVPDGTHAYSVAAIDRYGFEGAPGTASVPVGDVTAPGAPTGLVAAVEQSDVQLTWDPNPEPDIDHYVVLRDGLRIGLSTSPAYRDVGRPNGTYVYTVLAVDHEGLESEPSQPAAAVVARTTPPAPPEILVPTDAAHPVTVEVPATPVRGRSEPGTLVTVERDGVLVGVAPALPAFSEAGSWRLPGEAASSQFALEPDGLHLVYTRYVPEQGRYGLVRRHLGHGAESPIGPPDPEFPEALAFSGDGGKLAYRLSSSLLRVLTLADGSVTALDTTPGYGERVALSTDGGQAAFVTSYYSGGWRYALRVRDLATGTQRQLAVSSGPYYHLAWSPQGDRLAVLVFNGSTFRYEARLVDPVTGAQAVVAADAWPYGPPSWSPDGARLAYTRFVGGVERVSVYERASGASSDVTGGDPAAWDARFDLEGSWLTFLRETAPGPQGTRAELVARAGSGEERVAATIDTGWRGPLALQAWTRGGYLHVDRNLGDGTISILPGFDGAFALELVPLAPGENTLVARALEPLNGLSSADSQPVLVTVAEAAFPDLAVGPADVQAYPAAPVTGQAVSLSVRVRNQGPVAARGVPVALELLDAQGGPILQRSLQLDELAPGAEALLTASWTPALAGSYTLRGSADAGNFVIESREDNNAAERALLVAPAGGGALAASLTSDRERYPALALALLQGQLVNGGPPFTGSLRLAVETRDGSEVALVQAGALQLEHGARLDVAAQWNTGATYAGDYRFALRALSADGQVRAEAVRDFALQPDVRLLARLTPERASVPAGQAAAFSGRVDNLGVNAPLEGLRASFRVLPANGGDAVFTSELALPRLLPGAQQALALSWAPAQPAGDYVARLEVRAAAPAGTVLAEAAAPFSVVAAAPVALSGSLRLAPADVLTGQAGAAEVGVTNQGAEPLVAQPFTVALTGGASPDVLVQAAFTLDLEPGQTRTLTLPLDTAALAPGFYPAFLRSAAPARTLARGRLHVHGLIAPPSLDAPAEGARVASAHPALSVNNASTAEGAPLTYQFELYADPALQVVLPGTEGLAETPQRTAWTVDTNLAEDHTYYWRARASDGFSSSPWMAVASFTVDTADLPPTAPRVDWPAPGSRVATPDVTLVVRNGEDPERAPLTYEFRLAGDPELTNVVASVSGLPEQPGLTGWHVPVLLTEDATYYWSARASDGVNLSPWAEAAAFTVDALNAPPSAPTPVAPVGGVSLQSLQPELRVANATDAEEEPLTYVFQVDRSPAFDSPDLQVSPELPETPAETAWTPAPLLDNARWYWRASASDGHGRGPWAGSHFLVNLANDPPSTPVPLNPSDGSVVASPTPELRVRNAVDPDGDPLVYDFEVRAAGGSLVAAATVSEGADETAWVAAPALAENGTYTWTARARDAQAASGWTSPWTFRVNAVPDPPTAPGLIAPAEGAVVGQRRPALVVSNASSPDGLPLRYDFELYLVVAGTPALFDQATDVPEGAAQTELTPSLDLPDGDYTWRARAADAQQPGPWMASAHFRVVVDVPPAAPTGLAATPGDARVTLSWNASPEPDVTGYRVYRSLTAGGPFAPLGDVAAPGYLDASLANGVTYHYVVTALDAAFESPRSNEAAATPQGGAGPLPAEVRFWPATVHGECLLGCGCGDDAPEGGGPAAAESGGGGSGDDCPRRVKATVELPAGHDPAAIAVASVRVNGLVAPDPGYRRIVDRDGDGLPELEISFELRSLAPLLQVGANVLTVSGSVSGRAFAGPAALAVLPPRVTLTMSPRTLKLSSSGQTVQAHLSLEGCGSNADFDLASLRLNESVPIERVVSRPGRYDLIVKFDRAAVAAVLSPGARVEVRVGGLARGLPFVAVDYIKVLP